MPIDEQCDHRHRFFARDEDYVPCEECKRMERKKVYEAVDNEMDWQRRKWGADKVQSIPGYLLIMRRELDEAIDGWMKNDQTPRNSCLEEVVQVVAVGVRCLQDYGVKGCSRSTMDITEAEMAEERRQASTRRFGAA